MKRPRSADLKNVDGDRDLLSELIQISLQQSKDLIDRMGEAMDVKDAKTAERHAHTIKGSVQSIGATQAGDAAAVIETSAAQGDFNSAPQQMPQLREALDQLNNAVTQHSWDEAT